VEATEAMLRAHYADLEERLPVIAERNRKWMEGRIVIAVEVRGRNAVSIVRKLTGVTSPTAAAPGTLRGDLSCDSTELATLEQRTTQNLLHSAESPACAEAEIGIWFGATGA
jgi:nucleoside-diphosphate kinase